MNTVTSIPVQPIVVVPPPDDTSGQHLSVIAAAAVAAGLALLNVEPESPVWGDWLADSFTKSVRRASKPSQIDRVRNCTLPHVETEIAGVTAFAFAPMPYSQWPRELFRLQVSGLDLREENGPREIYVHGATNRPSIVLSDSVAMTTGKAAAQAAHALVIWLMMWLTRAPDEVRSLWSHDPGVHIAVGNTDAVQEPRIEIHDNGLTEIEPGTLTAVARDWPAHDKID